MTSKIEPTYSIKPGVFRLSLLAVLIMFGLVPTSGFSQKGKEAQEIKNEKEEYDNDAERLGNMFGILNDRITSGEVKDPVQAKLTEYEEYKKMKNTSVLQAQSFPDWRMVAHSQGGHVSGRARIIAFEPNNPKVAYVATAQSGLWRTEDITATPPTWTNLSERWPTLVMGAVAIDPKNPSIIYAGTGEHVGGFSCPVGVGMLKSTDRGASWELVSPASEIGTACSQILIDPTNSDIVWVATGTDNNGVTKGLMKTTDGGKTWNKASTASGAPISIVINPQDPNYMNYGTTNGGLYGSTDHGATWTKRTLPSGTSGTVMLAIAPSSPNIVYASVGKSSGGTYGVLMSNDNGLTWTAKNTNVNYMGTQQFYANAITVNANNPSELMVGGLDIYYSNDNGQTLNKISDWTSDINESDFSHADVHYLAYNVNQYYAATDGGLSASANGSAWNTTMNVGINSLQFVGVDADKNFTYVLGGTQDNGVNRAMIGSDVEWEHVRGGDAGVLWISPDDPNIAFSTYVYTDVRKSKDGGKSWMDNPSSSADSKNPQNFITNPALKADGAPFYPAFDVAPAGDVIAFGGNRYIWVSTNGGDDGFQQRSTKAVGSPGSSQVNVIHIAPIPEFMWAGVGSSIQFSSNTGLDWTKAKVGSGTSTTFGASVTGIVSDPDNSEVVYAVTSGVGPNIRHFWKSVDGGATFDSVPGSNFPNIAANSIAYHSKRKTLFVGLDNMVIYSKDDGKTWGVLGTGLPMVQVLTLKIKGENDDKLLAGTFGRGCYYIDLPAELANPDPGSIAQRDVKDVVSVGSLTLEQSYPNPVVNNISNATIGFSLKEGAVATVTLYDQVGREVSTLAKGYYPAGRHTLQLNTKDLSAGTYYYTLSSNGNTLSQKLIVTK